MNANYKRIILASGLLLALSALTSAAPGDPDPTFGSGGIVITRGNNINYLNTAWAMAIQSDGKIVVVGEGGDETFSNVAWGFAIVRYNTNGSLDSSFGDNGRVVTQLTNDYDGASAVAIQADGKIVVAGSRFNCFCIDSSFAVVRYNTDGSLDTSFNGTGIVVTQVAGSRDYAESVAIQSDGKIVVGGRSGNFPAIVRYNSNGSLDSTFNGTGKLIAPVGGGVNSIAIQSDGKIIAAGFGFTLARYNTDGSLDTSFNGMGVVTPVGNFSGASDLAIQADGKIVVVGFSGVPDAFTTADFAVVRYNPNGSLDSSFGGTGKITIPVGNSWDFASSVAIQVNGKIVVAGYSRNNNFVGSDFAVVRLTPNGSLDTTFNGTGKVTTAFGAQDFTSAVAIQTDGKIVVVGGTDDILYDFYDFVVVRYQGDEATACSNPNPIDCPDFFVRQHYRDFLEREPEPTGLAAWLSVLNNCPAGDLVCQHERRLITSAAFFGSLEFQLKGYFVFRLYRVAFARLPEYSEFSPDMRSVTGQTPEEVYARKGAFINNFVQRPEFVTLFNGLSNADYVAALLGRYNLNSIITPDPLQPDGTTKVTLTQSQLVSHLEAGALTRAQVLRAIADSDLVLHEEFNRAFVAMQYYGYLRRTPELTGYNSWLNYLNSHPDFREMVRGFVDSIEYRTRFGP